jgi:hypothetical protein
VFSQGAGAEGVCALFVIGVDLFINSNKYIYFSMKLLPKLGGISATFY